MENRPKISVGVPVHNGQAHIEATLRSLAAQDYPDLEIRIGDNASTDATGEIARSFLADSRFQYHRESVDVGATRNFLNLYEASEASFFMWASCGEEWQPDHLSKLAELLVRFPSADLAVSHVGLIDDSSGARTDSFWYRNPVPTVGLAKVDRMRYLLRTEGGPNVYGHMFYGLYRRRALAHIVPLIRDAEYGYGSDVLSILALLSRGDLVVSPEQTFWYRTGGASASFEFKNLSDYQAYCAFCADCAFRNMDLSGLEFEELKEIHAKMAVFIKYFTGFDSSYQENLIRQAWEASRQ